MECEAARLTCAVLEVAEALRGGPTPFEVVAQVVVPLLLGLGTLVVAFLSFRVARQSTALAEQSIEVARQTKEVAEQSTKVAAESHRLARKMREDAMAERLRGERDEFALSLVGWVEAELTHLATMSRDSLQYTTALQLELVARAHSMDSPNAPQLHAEVRQVLQAAEKLTAIENKNDWVLGQALWMTRSWQHNPLKVVTFKETAPAFESY